MTLLVANATARTGRAAKAITRAMDTMRDAKLEPEFFGTSPNGATVAALARRIEQDDVQKVVYLGGDGTFAEAAKAIILARERTGVDVPLGMLPMGTANDQGRSFGILAGPRALPANVAIIAEGVEQWLDVGRIEAFDTTNASIRQDLWFDSCGVGLSAQILAARNRDRMVVSHIPLVRRIYRDKIVYASAAVRSFLTGMLGRAHFSCELTIDGDLHEYTGVTDLVISGTMLYGGDWIFDPESKPDDGRFEVVVLRGHTDWTKAAIGAHKRNPLTHDDREVLGLQRRSVPKGAVIELKVMRPDGLDHIYAQIDGEEFVSADHYRIENLFHHLRIIVPSNPHWV